MKDTESQLKQAIEALALDDRPRPGQKEHARRRMREAFQLARSEPSARVRFRPVWRSIMQSKLTKSAVAAMVAAAAFFFLHTVDRSSGLAWADVLEQIRDFRPYQCTETVLYTGREPFRTTLKRLNLSQRREERENGQTLIFDLRQCPVRTLVLDEPSKTARLTVDYSMGPAQDPDFFRMLAQMKEGDAQRLETKEIGGRRAQGFRTVNEYNDITIWADVETGLPVRLEIIHVQRERKIVFDDFLFDVAFDESLFSTDPPPGYQVHEQVIDAPPAPKEEPSEVAVLPAETTERFIPFSAVQTAYRNGQVFSRERVYMQTLSRVRYENESGEVTVCDFSERPERTLTLNPSQNTAHLLIDYTKGPSERWNMLASLTGMIRDGAERLGTKEINGQTAVGFRRVNPANDLSIWADVETGLPVRVEVIHTQANQTVVMSDFDFRTDMPEELFSTDPPPGYDVKEESVGLDFGVKTVTPEEAGQTAAIPVYALSNALSWTRKPGLVEFNDPSQPGQKGYVVAAAAPDGRHVAIAQSQSSLSLRDRIRDGGSLCLEQNGFTVWNGGPEKWYSGIALQGAGGMIPPGLSEDRTGYAVETPAGSILIIGVNGALSEAELAELIGALIRCGAPAGDSPP